MVYVTLQIAQMPSPMPLIHKLEFPDRILSVAVAEKAGDLGQVTNNLFEIAHRIASDYIVERD